MADERPSVRSVRAPDRSKGHDWSLTDRLSEAQLRQIITDYESGTPPRWQLAEQHRISLSSVGRLLRKWREEGDDAA